MPRRWMLRNDVAPKMNAELLGVVLNCFKSQVQFPPGTNVEQWPDDDRAILARTQLTLVSAGLKIVGIPVREITYITKAVHEASHGEPAALPREPAQMEDLQASLQIKHLYQPLHDSTSSRELFRLPSQSGGCEVRLAVRLGLRYNRR